MWPIQHPCLRAHVSIPTDTGPIHTPPACGCQEKSGCSVRQFASMIPRVEASSLNAASQGSSVVIIWAASSLS